MKLYLVRHAKAENGTGMTPAEDDARELTKKGKRQMKRVAKLLREKASIARIVTSPLPRAEQTARVLGRVLDVHVTEAQALKTPTTLSEIQTFIRNEPRKDGLAIVTHEPYITQLARALLGKFPAGKFKKGAVLALDYETGGHATFDWMILPKGPRVVDKLDVLQSGT